MTQPHVLMLVQNEWRTDSRVIREAEALVRAGYRVQVICRRNGEEIAHEEQNGVKYLCLPISQARSYLTYLPPVVLWMRLPALLSLTLLRRRRWSSLLGAAVKALCFYAGGVVVTLALAPVAAIGLLLIVALRAIAQHNAALRSALRSRSRSVTRFAIRPFTWLLQAPVYLHDFAVAALPHIRQIPAEVIHAHDLVTLPAAFVAARSSDCRYVYDAHELETHTNYWGLNGWTRLWIGQYERSLIQLADASITVCDSIADWLKEHYSIPRPIIVMNAPRLEIPQVRTAAPRNVRDELGLPGSAPLMLYVGSVTIDRGLELCVQALAHMPSVHFAVVGPQYQPIVEKLRAIAAQNATAERLHIMAPVPSQSVIDYVRGADCSVIAIQNVCLSYYFCFPNKLLESVFAGVPVAVANLAELERFIRKYPVGKVMNERSPESIAEAVTSIIRQPQRFRPSVEQLRLIQAEYGWEAQEARLRALYQDLLPRLLGAARHAA